jgi:hypothetical protein
MADRRLTPEETDLRRARAAAQECEIAASQLVEFAERMSPVLTAAEMVEFDTLVAREATALSRRVDAFGRLGLGVGSLDSTGSAE